MTLTIESRICKDIIDNKCFDYMRKSRKWVMNKKTGRVEADIKIIEPSMQIVSLHAKELVQGNRSPFTCSNIELGNYYSFIKATDHYLKCLGIRIYHEWRNRKVFTIFCNGKLENINDYPFIKLAYEYDGNSGYVWMYVIEAKGLVEWLGEESIVLSHTHREQVGDDYDEDDE